MHCQKQNGRYLSTCLYVCLSNICSEVLKQVTTIEAWPLRELWLWIRVGNCSGQGTSRSVNLSDAANRDREGNIGFHCEWDNLNRTTTSVHDNTIVNSSGGIMLTNKLSIVQAIDKNTLRWFGLVMGRNEESMLRVVMQLKTKGKRPRGNTWLDNIDLH